MIRRTMCSLAVKHPIVDCSVLLSGDMKHPQRDEVLKSIREAVQSNGYFYASGVASLPENYISEVSDPPPFLAMLASHSPMPN